MIRLATSPRRYHVSCRCVCHAEELERTKTTCWRKSAYLRGACGAVLSVAIEHLSANICPGLQRNESTVNYVSYGMGQLHVLLAHTGIFGLRISNFQIAPDGFWKISEPENLRPRFCTQFLLPVSAFWSTTTIIWSHSLWFQARNVGFKSQCAILITTLEASIPLLLSACCLRVQKNTTSLTFGDVTYGSVIPFLFHFICLWLILSYSFFICIYFFVWFSTLKTSPFSCLRSFPFGIFYSLRSFYILCFLHVHFSYFFVLFICVYVHSSLDIWILARSF